jgi:hypothetical protein
MEKQHFPTVLWHFVRALAASISGTEHELFKSFEANAR